MEIAIDVDHSYLEKKESLEQGLIPMGKMIGTNENSGHQRHL